MFKFIILVFFITYNTFSCNNPDDIFDIYSSNKLNIWLGNNSEFSKTFLKTRCILDKNLQSLSLEKKKLIITLIKKSYEFDIEKNEQHYSF